MSRAERFGSEVVPSLQPRKSRLFLLRSGFRRHPRRRLQSLESERIEALSRSQRRDAPLYFYVPGPAVAEQGAIPGTLLFDGRKVGSSYEGTAYVFSSKCGAASYQVKAALSDNSRRIEMVGDAPELDAACRVSAFKRDVLIFTYLSNADQ